MTDPPLDASLDLVSDRHRRRAIKRLRSAPDGTATVDDLVDDLHASEPMSVDDGRPDRERIAIQLVHVHLPKLTDHGVVDLDPDGDTVRYRPDEQVETVLDSLPGDVRQPTP